MDIIELYRDDATVFVNLDTVSRISFATSKDLRQSDRVVKVVFTDGSKAEYVGHRNLQKVLSGKTLNYASDKTEE